ncbi:regulator [Kribbella sindirgiensis]|uniref:Regulator n=1 Tax=Kribbella sindirgiensis TaxID=1124744 RepID=A0A4R0JC41_9ACTN|nr:regulator [Kribbella sindirgiensis]TCC43597.1 regulator [Kribbella sindirgiensis]
MTLALTFSESRDVTIQTSRMLWTEDLKRSEFLRMAVSAGSLTTPLARWLISPPADPPYGTGSSRRVGADDVAAVRATLHMFESLDHQFGGGHARSAAVQYLSDAVTPLLHARYTDAIGRELFSVAAQFTYKTGAMAYDVGMHGLARRYFVQALNLAHASGDRPLGGKVLALMSHQANYLGEYQEAVDLARAAALGAGSEATSRTRAMYAAMEARGLASIGDKRACLRMMKQADASFAQASGDDEPDWIEYFDQAELQDELAHCFTSLRAPRDAENHANLALSQSSDLHPRSRTFCRVSLATSYLDAGDVPRACDTAIEAVTAAGRIKSARIRNYVRVFDRRLNEFGSQRSITEFRERAGTLLAS